MVIKKISNNIHCLHPGSCYQELQWPSLPFLFFFKWPCSFQFTIGYFANQKKKKKKKKKKNWEFKKLYIETKKS